MFCQKYSQRLHGILQLINIYCVRLVLVKQNERCYYFLALFSRQIPLYTIHFSEYTFTFIYWQIKLIREPTVHILVHACERDIIAIV